MKKSFYLFLVLGHAVVAQTSTTQPGIVGQNGAYKTITTAVPFLTITPDARAAGMGDNGVATSADVNSSYWNPAKMVFVENKWGAGLSYTPWLAKIINDMHVAYLSGYYKISRLQTISASIKQFDMGEVDLRDASNNSLGTFNPQDWSFDVNYSRLLSENLSLGGTIRYISSRLTGTAIGTGAGDAKVGRSVAVDFGLYYTKPMVSKNSVLSLGLALTNIGAKVTYIDANNKSFIPSNLRLGGAYKIEPSPMSSFTFVLDFNKLMVPSPDPNDPNKANKESLLQGIFGSFSDAPGGFKEEIHEVTASAGVEYWYNNTIAGRLGYFNEAKDKGNRKYLTGGAGFRYNSFGLDLAYMLPVNKRQNALAETIRITLIYIPKIKETGEVTNQ